MTNVAGFNSGTTELTNVALIDAPENPRDYRPRSYYNHSLLVPRAIVCKNQSQDFPILGNRRLICLLSVPRCRAVHRPAIASRSDSRALNRPACCICI
ncbi:hypothetical protein PUN28_009194 [Cardiocondyla obscurior]|uniref:Uncharacterized protein n=1 Tax=Cardiocondyla obscurior TaxID=286306 RepID=A0AAW2FQX8_9HYME